MIADMLLAILACNQVTNAASSAATAQDSPDSGEPTSGDTDAEDSDTAPVDTATADDSGDTATSDSGGGEAADPFAPQPDDDEGLTNVAEDLKDVLEHGDMERACEAYEADPADRRKKLLCGKSMYFNESFGTIGIPAPLFDFVNENFPDQTGKAFSQYGLVPDPYSDEGRPIGFAAGAELPDAPGVETLALTCAACHFGRLPDGRYAVGAANHDYDYGTHMLSLVLVPQVANPLFDESAHSAEALAKVQPIIDVLRADWLLQLTLLWDLLPLLSAMDSMGNLDATAEGYYASWLPGTMDFAIAPLPVDDGVHTVSKIIPLWGIPTASEEAAAGMPHAMLAWSGGATSLEQFLTGFVVIGGGPLDEWPEERLEPLAEYIRSLRAPENASLPGTAESRAIGESVFYDEGCVECHGAPRGSGDRVYTYAEIGTDDAMMYWGDPDLDGELCCGLGFDEASEATHGIKSPRIAGAWTMGRFLHNGSVETLDGLLCLQGSRPSGLEAPFGDDGHFYGCDLPEDERQALVDWLHSI
ncbi:MAG: hypothetical protein FJ090_06300 [Deltaproteobacteria bacterium]|nr:hypothetical protein [Deltaproteobacteria bacterium]